MKLREKIEPEIARIQKLKKPTDISLDQLRSKKEYVTKKLETAQDGKRKIQEAVTQLPLLQKALLKAQKDIKDRKEDFLDYEKELTRIKSEIEKQEKKMMDNKATTSKTRAHLKHEKRELEQKLRKTESQQSKVEDRISNFDKMIDNKKCPLCERAIYSEISDKRSHFREEAKELQQK